MSTPEAQLVWCLRQRREYHSTDGVRWYQVDEPDGDCQRAAETIERLTAERDALRADAEIGRQWREDSSLEKWFPLTAERLAALEAETAALKREAHTWWTAARAALAAAPAPASVLAYMAVNREGEARFTDNAKAAEELERYGWAITPLSQAPAPLTDEQLRDALRQCPHDTVEALRVRWLYAKDFARAIERAHGIGTDARAQAQGGKP